MTIIISKVSNIPTGEQWRVLVVEDGEEVYHDTALSKGGAMRQARLYLEGRS